eukprot:762928-Hanusia_phi.AAC.4
MDPRGMGGGQHSLLQTSHLPIGPHPTSSGASGGGVVALGAICRERKPACGGSETVLGGVVLNFEGGVQGVF